ncbi:MAG: glucosaminidase domain-containing protein [Alistipes sp.]|nr:glucosaminidase domain-containing protein [Alistipes sp.]
MTKHLNTLVLTLTLLCATASTAWSQTTLSRADYIQKYKSLALQEMDIYGIPASIKLAQAIHESDNGNSRLAREGNNHFGIKCKSDWKGATIAHTDDAPDECFRKYASVEDSYRDHSEFLDKSSRYQNLFQLDPTDYKGWAKGLQQDGYATNPQYAERLIKIIEENQLFLLDEGKDLIAQTQDTTTKEEPVVPAPKSGRDIIDVDNYSIVIQSHNGGHTVYRNNGSEFVILAEGETLETIASEFRTSSKRLVKYNDLHNASEVKAGDMVYLKPKGRRSANGKLIHVAKEGESLHSISQLYGIRIKQLCNFNRRTRDSQVTDGQQIRLM